MTAGLKTIIYPVSDLAQAKKIFGALLGVAPSVDEAYYVHFNVAEQEIGLLPDGHTTGMTGPVGTGGSRTSRKASSCSSTPAR